MLRRTPFQIDAGAFGEDGDAALALQVIAVERAFGDVLIVPEGARLLQAVRRTSVVFPWSTWAMMAILRMSMTSSGFWTRR